MSVRKSKKVQTSSDLTGEECSRLILFVKENELYINTRRNPSARQKQWNDISHLLGKDGVYKKKQYYYQNEYT